MATAKLNREKLKKMISQQEEAPLTLGKKRKTDSSSKKVVDERSLPLPPPAPKPSVAEPVSAPSVEVIEIPSAPSSSMTIEKAPTLPRDASLASRRAKTVVTKDDVNEYEKVNTDVIKVAGVHSLMKVCRHFLIVTSSFSSETNHLPYCLGFDGIHGDCQPLPSVGGRLDEAQSSTI